MRTSILNKLIPFFITMGLLWTPTFTQAELLLPAEEVLLAHVAVLKEDNLIASLDEEEDLWQENGFDDFEDEEFAELEGIPDPLEPWNRFWFGFNDKFYFWFFKPVAQGYSAVIPEDGRVGIRNVFHNIAMPIRFINAMLQAKPKIAMYELCRFLVNTSVGLGGYFDVASRDPELRSYGEDLGQTFGVWGIGHGVYLVWPLLGSSSVRDTVGRVGDGFMHPLHYVGLSTFELAGIRAYEYTNKGSLKIGEYEDLKEASLDPYIAMRNAYYQYRKAEVEK
jgi:phospholipid-binding lipoprotein MlaA